MTKARTVPFHGKDLLGPNMTEFDQKILDMRDQHSIHWDLTTHFKIPKKLSPKAAAVAKSVLQRLGPLVNQDGCQFFWNNQRQQDQSSYASSTQSASGTR